MHKLNTSGNHSGSIKSSDSRNSLKRRRLRLKKKQRSESGSNNSDSSNRRSRIGSLTKSESFSGSIFPEESQNGTLTVASSTSEIESEDRSLPKPNFQLGAYTSGMFTCSSATKLGSLAPLAFYNCDQDMTPVREPSYTGTEENSNPDQQAWDDYQEKYMSEAYSEGRDSDAARKLLEFGDDYRNFLDSQSDCCSSLSAANNLDSMSPPRNRKMLPVLPNKAPSDEDNTMRRRRELEFERRRRAFAESTRRFTAEGTISAWNFHGF